MSPVERLADGVSFGNAAGDVLGLDADLAPDIVLIRADESGGSLANLLGPLRAARPDVRLVELPADAAYLRIVPLLDILTMQRFIVNPRTGSFRTLPLDPSTVRNVQVSVSATVRDARGLLYEVESTPATLTSRPRPILLPLQPGVPGQAPAAVAEKARMAGPLQIAQLSLDVWLPANTAVGNGLAGLASVAAASASNGPWRAVDLTSTGAWRATMLAAGQQSSVPADKSKGLALPLTGGGAQGTMFGEGLGGPPAHVALTPGAIANLPSEVPVVVNAAFLAAASAKLGDDVTARLDGFPRTLIVAGTVAQFPGTDGSRPAVVIDEPTLGLLRLQATGTTRDADEWWFSASEATAHRLAAVLADAPFRSSEVLTAADRARTLGRDPVAVGILGALALGFVAAALFAVVGLVVSAAVSARQRRTEFAVLRALGLSGGQLSRWLWLENGSVVAVSVLAGTGLGLLIGWLVLPFVTVTQQGTTPVPAVIVEVPWERIALLDVVGAVALAAAVGLIGALLRRRGVGSTLRMGED
jgi:hypothetical protein